MHVSPIEARDRPCCSYKQTEPQNSSSHDSAFYFIFFQILGTNMVIWVTSLIEETSHAGTLMFDSQSHINLLRSRKHHTQLPVLNYDNYYSLCIISLCTSWVISPSLYLNVSHGMTLALFCFSRALFEPGRACPFRWPPWGSSWSFDIWDRHRGGP